MKTLNDVAENYFNTLNPIAKRISTDILAIREAYEDLWICLSPKEKNQIINETVVHPEALLRYTLDSKSIDFKADHPFENTVTGSKYIVDENTGLSWRDEHSAPFSWKTPSQIDLTVFASSDGDASVRDSGFPVNSNNLDKAGNEKFTEIDGTHGVKIEPNSAWTKYQDKYAAKKSTLSPESANTVVVGTCSKLSGFCSKFKFLPGKSYSYEVRTVLTSPAASNDGSLFEKIKKATTVLKFQNTLKLMGGKALDKKVTENVDTENLVNGKNSTPVTVAKLQKPSPKIAKPKSPPPPPPILKEPRTEHVNQNKVGKSLIAIKTPVNNEPNPEESDSEKVVLLQDNRAKSSSCTDLENMRQDFQAKNDHEASDDFQSLSTECTSLNGPKMDFIPKSGFDFLDNW